MTWRGNKYNFIAKFAENKKLAIWAETNSHKKNWMK